MLENSAIRSDVSSRPAKKHAKVWEHIETEIVDRREHSSCKYCKTKLSTGPGIGTNHLNRHIALYYHNIPAEDRDRFLLTWKPHNSAIVPHVFEPHVFRLLIAKFFVSAEIAFRKADDPHWKNLINYCQPSFRVVGRQTVASDCIELYEEEKKQLQIFIEKQASDVNLTADMWTSNQNLGYICVTAHFIDDLFELWKMIVAFKKIAFSHTSYVVQDGITSCLLDWDLTSKFFTLTLDNASVNDRAAKDLRAALGAEIFFKGEHLHVRCAGHVHNIIVQDGLKLISYALMRVRVIVITVTSTPSRMQIFNSILQRMGLKTKAGLVLDVPYRWNATYDMLHDALENRVALDRYAIEQYGDGPSEEDWKNAEALHSFLQAFNEAAKAFSADRYPTSHSFLKFVLAIRDVLLDSQWDRDTLLQGMASAIFVKFQKYWDNLSIVFQVASVLDPTLKLDFPMVYFHTIGVNVVDNMKDLCIYLGLPTSRARASPAA